MKTIEAPGISASREPQAEGAQRTRIRLAHIFSSDLGIPSSLPYVAPLRERNWEVTFLTPEGPDVSKAAALGYRWLPISFTRTMDPLGDLRATLELSRILASERFDIVHTHNFKVSLVGRVLAALSQTPIVLHTIHGITWSLDTPEPSRSVNAALERIASFGADLILSQSQTDRDAFVTMKVVPPEKIRVIGNGVDLTRFDPSAISADTRPRLRAALGVGDAELLVLFPGRMVREKGLEEVYEAAHVLRGEPIRIAIAGRDDAERGDAPSAESLARARDAGVLFLGERKDMPQLYAAADVVGLASWREGMPRALIEGAAMARPLVATDIRGCKDVVRHGETGLLFEVRSPPAIASALRALAADPSLRARLGARGREDALERFDIRAVVQRVVDSYDQLIQRKMRR
jgi:glycosyltransferase involved in cell wall biosynthesis